MARSSGSDSEEQSSRRKHKKHKKHHHKDEHRSSKHSSKRDSEEPHKKRHKRDYERDKSNDSPRKSKKPKHSKWEESTETKTYLPTDIHIKNESDFDRRQEELRRARVERDTDNHRWNGDRRRNDNRRREERQRRDENGTTHQAFQVKQEKPEEKEEEKEKEKPNLGLSGALTEDTNTYKGVVIKYNEPPEAKVPKRRWRLYPFKGTESLKILHLHRQSAYLLGRQRRIADIPIDHPSCSKQHAVLQFRCVIKEVDGVTKKMVRPYVIDLGSGNGTYLNNNKIDAQRYYELKEKDVLKFGFSSREYVLLHAKSDTSEVDVGEEDDDVESEEG